ncbi:nucleolar pre-ribosomal-associated protein 1 [Bulinus truncatus]|nr:nucleolar pre-ribosomal-associated protein 1 [Bulinus truncatus]
MSKQTRKRSLLNENIEEERNATSPKKAKESVTFISDVEFKFLLRDEETVVEGLEKFIQTAEAFIDGVPCPDIVSSFCISSPNLAEFWNLIEPSSCKLKINDVALVFECLEQILARIRNDLVKLSSVGEAIVQKVLAVHMGQLYYSLRDQNNSRTIKSGLKLLIAMVLLSDKSKKAILSRLNFGHQNFHPLFNRRNRKDPQDVRSCVVLLTLAFLLDSDNTVINFLVQQKTFLQSVIGGLMYDPKEVVIDTLATLMDKVVKCPGVSKTDKVKLFSEVSLKKICELLSWKGPGGWRAGKKKSDQDEEVDVPDDDRQVVADVAHNFLTELCCSHKHGINFHDKTLGIGNRNQNQLLTHFLEWLVKTIDDAHTSDLIISILCTCPDQIQIVLNNLCAFLSPRWSEKWIKLMDWLAKLYISLPEDLQFLAEKDTANEANKIVSMAVILCLPPPKVCVTLQQGSLIAFGKLQGVLKSDPLLLPDSITSTRGMFLGNVAALVYYMMSDSPSVD